MTGSGTYAFRCDLCWRLHRMVASGQRYAKKAEHTLALACPVRSETLCAPSFPCWTVWMTSVGGADSVWKTVGVRILKLRQWGVPCERQRLLSAPPCCVPHLYCSWPFSCANGPSQSFSLKPRRCSPRVHKSHGCWLSSSLGFLRSCFVSATWSNFTTALF